MRSMKSILSLMNYILKLDFHPSSISQMTFHVMEIKELEEIIPAS